MQSTQQHTLIRKQYLITPSQIDKVGRLATERGASSAEIVRLAIDAYDPLAEETMAGPELMELVSSRLKEAITLTRKANHIVSETLIKLDGGE